MQDLTDLKQTILFMAATDFTDEMHSVPSPIYSSYGVPNADVPEKGDCITLPSGTDWIVNTVFTWHDLRTTVSHPLCVVLDAIGDHS